MDKVLQNVLSNAQSLEGLEYLWFTLSCIPGAIGLILFLIGAYYACFKEYHATNVGDIGGVFQAIGSLLGIAMGLVLMGLSAFVLMMVFGGS